MGYFAFSSNLNSLENLSKEIESFYNESGYSFELNGQEMVDLQMKILSGS